MTQSEPTSDGDFPDGSVGRYVREQWGTGRRSRGNRASVTPVRPPEPEQPEAAPEGRDWTETLHLVHRAASRLVSTDERVRDLEAELRELSDSAAEEIQRLRAEVVELQRQLDAAEDGRRHAEDWLRRLHTAVLEQFGAQLEPARETTTQVSAAS